MIRFGLKYWSFTTIYQIFVEIIESEINSYQATQFHFLFKSIIWKHVFLDFFYVNHQLLFTPSFWKPAFICLDLSSVLFVTPHYLLLFAYIVAKLNIWHNSTVNVHPQLDALMQKNNQVYRNVCVISQYVKQKICLI